MAFLIIAVFALFIGAGVYMERKDKKRLREMYAERNEQARTSSIDAQRAEPLDDAADL